MKKLVFLGFFLVFLSQLTHSQRCGTFAPGDNILMPIDGDINAEYNIRVYWNWVRQDDGSSANSESLIKNIIDLVKTEFASIGINLISSCASGDDNFTIMDNTFIYNATDQESVYDGNCFLTPFCMDDGLNVFFTKGTINGLPQGLGSAPGNRLYVSIDEIDEWTTVVHEIGHCFGLFHTYEVRPWEINIPGGGVWRCDNQGGITSDMAMITDCDGSFFSATVPIELVDGSNATISGDFVADTPADIDYWGTCETDIEDCSLSDPCGLVNYTDTRFLDPNCEPYDPDYNNFMSARRFCWDHFSTGQISRMKGVIESRLQYMIAPTKPIVNELDCTTPTVDLNSLHQGNVPYNAELFWSTDDDPTDGVDPILPSQTSTNGTYYAYYYFSDEGCYSKASDPVLIDLVDTDFSCNPCDGPVDIIIDVSQSLGSTLISGDLIIKAGAILTVEGTVQFSQDSRVLVKPGAHLIIQNFGKLTKCDDAEYWQGVLIEGLNNSLSQGGEVDIFSRGTIEYASVGVEKANSITNSFGGVQTFTTANVGRLYIGGGFIRHCEIGVKLNSTGGSIFGTTGLETSSMHTAIFEENVVAILLKNNRGLTVFNTRFSDNEFGIEINNSFVDIQSNHFINNTNAAVFINAAYPTLMGSNIWGNSFLGNSTPGTSYPGFLGGFSIFNESLNNAEYLNIRSNIMINNDIYNLGISTFNIANNDLLDGYHAITSSATGQFNFNLVENNSFFNNEIGNNVDGINNIEYLTNCFEATTRADIGLGIATTIDGEQGNFDDSAGNCFDNGSRIQTREIDNPATAFEYYTKDGSEFSSGNCKAPGNGNFSVELSNNESDNSSCGSGVPLFGDLPERYRDCEDYLASSDTDLEAFIQALEDEIDRLNQLIISGHITLWVANRLIEKYRECIDSAIKEIVINILTDNDGLDRDDAITFLTTRPEFRYQIMAYGLMLDDRDFSSARALLQSLTPDREDEMDFVAVQLVYLDYLETPETYILDQHDRNRIYEAGEKRLPLAGFARTVYHQLTGDRHFITVPVYDGTAHNRAAKIQQKEEEITIYPNPMIGNDRIHISIKEAEAKNNVYNCEIFNAMGVLITRVKIGTGDNQLEINTPYTGVLLVRIMHQGKIIHTDRVIKL